MRYTKVKISNYKSFREETEFELGPGFNVIVGKNNSGKTAVLELLSGKFEQIPHRSPLTAVVPGMTPQGRSIFEFSMEFEGQNLLATLDSLEPTFRIPIHPPRDQRQTWDAFSNLLAADHVILKADYVPGGRTDHAEFPEFGFSTNRATNAMEGQSLKLERSDTWRPAGRNPVVAGGQTDRMLPMVLSHLTLSRIYAFRAERLNVDKSPIGEPPTLLPNASNLPNAIHHMQTHNNARFMRYNGLVGAILPDVQMVTSVMIGNQFQLMVWTSPPEDEREDLAIHLSECGTGVGQILAILDVIVNSEFPRIILIDEPQSFLHPGAITKLFEIIRTEQRHKHQIIVTTHSPHVIAAADPSTILHVTKEGMESRVTQIDRDDRNATQFYLHEIGVRLSDVFGADRILWVEGPTEVQSFPHILRKIEGFSQLGLKVVEIRATGDLEKKYADATFDIYKRLSSGAALVPPTVAFLLDSENRTPEEIADHKRRQGVRVEFLPRMMYENYLIDAEAILDVLQRNHPAGNHALKDVEDWISTHRWEPKYFDKKKLPPNQTIDEWNKGAHGANFLNDLFRDLAGPELPYDKVVYGEELTKFLVEADDPGMLELREFLTPIVRRE